LLSTTTLTELLSASGREIAVVTTSSSGACLLQNHRSAGLTVNGDFIDPAASREYIETRFGPAPAKASPAKELNEWAASILTDYVLPELQPQLTIVWLCDPDKTQHTYGLGASESLSAIRTVDSIVGRIVGALETQGSRDQTNLIVMSDHGWVSYRDRLPVKSVLVDAGLKRSTDSGDIKVVGQGVYVDPEGSIAIEDIVDCLHRMDEIGAVFTRRVMNSAIPFSEILYDHPRSPDILFAPTWDDTRNVNNIAGMSFGGGPGGHGGSSTYEMQPFLAANGPGFKQGIEIETATGHVDLLPTILHLLEHPQVPGKDGRILFESLSSDGPVPETEPVQEIISAKGGAKNIELRRSRIDDVIYIDSANCSAS
jgi:arylsulfatase A-like enzyme